MNLSRRSLALSAAGLATLAASVAVAQLGGRLAPTFDTLSDASRPWLGIAALAFLAAFFCTVGAWHGALTSAGAQICPRQAAARLGVGSLVNSFAPAKLGDAVKIALCSRAIASPGRLWTTGGAYGALVATRSLALAGLVVAASLTRAMPLWPVFILASGAVVVGLAALFSSRLRSHSRVAHLLDGLTALVHSPRALAKVIAWTAGMQVARLAGTVAVAQAFGLSHPLLAALVILPALDVAGAIPITPGSIGVGSGAVAVALASRGVGMTQALGIGLGIQAVETIVSMSCGTAGVFYLLRPNERARRVMSRVALVGVSVGLASVLGLTVLDLF